MGKLPDSVNKMYRPDRGRPVSCQTACTFWFDGGLLFLEPRGPSPAIFDVQLTTSITEYAVLRPTVLSTQHIVGPSQGVLFRIRFFAGNATALPDCENSIGNSEAVARLSAPRPAVPSLHLRGLGGCALASVSFVLQRKVFWRCCSNVREDVPMRGAISPVVTFYCGGALRRH